MQGLIVLDDRYQCVFRHHGFLAASPADPTGRLPIASPCMHAARNISEGMRQSNAAPAKRWLTFQDIGLGKKGLFMSIDCE